MRLYAMICYAVAAAAEMGGLVFAVLALRENQAIRKLWMAANPKQNDGGSWGQMLLLNRAVPALLGKSTWQGRVAVVLIVLGIIAGTLGNFASLPS